MNEEKHPIKMYQCTYKEYEENVLKEQSGDDDKKSSSDKKNNNQTKEKSQ